MPLLTLLIFLAVVLFLCWAIPQAVPMSPRAARTFQIALLVLFFLWIAKASGLIAWLARTHIG